MKKKILVWLILLATNFGIAQEWMTSLAVAQRLALAQNKMLFVMWENATTYEYPVVVVDEKGKGIITDLLLDEKIEKILWEYFVPVVLLESQYDRLLKEVGTNKSSKYLNKFNDEGIKIMDANGVILNLDEPNYEIFDLLDFINRYALNTVSLQPYYRNYRDDKNYNNTSRLAMKLYDFAVVNKKEVRKEIVALANIYLEEARNRLKSEQKDNTEELMQRSQLNELKQYLILDKPKKVLRELKKLEEIEIVEENKPTQSFLYYTSYMLLNRDSEALPWKSDVSLIDLKRAQLIINTNK